MSLAAHPLKLKKVVTTNCTSVFSFEWHIENYFPEPYVSEDFFHPLFSDDLWFIKFDPPSSPSVDSEAKVSVIPQKALKAKVGIILHWNNEVIIRTTFDPSRQALLCKKKVQNGFEMLIGTSICLRCDLFYPSNLIPDGAVPKTLESDLKCFMLDSGKLKSTADFKLISSDGVNSVAAHRLILAARSPYFSAMFSMDSDEKKFGAVHLKTTPMTVLNNALPLIYDERKDLEKLSLFDAIELFKFADQYDFPHMKLALECNLATRLSLESLPSIEQLTLHINSEILSRAIANLNPQPIEPQTKLLSGKSNK